MAAPGAKRVSDALQRPVPEERRMILTIIGSAAVLVLLVIGLAGISTGPDAHPAHSQSDRELQTARWQGDSLTEPGGWAHARPAHDDHAASHDAPPGLPCS